MEIFFVIIILLLILIVLSFITVVAIPVLITIFSIIFGLFTDYFLKKNLIKKYNNFLEESKANYPVDEFIFHRGKNAYTGGELNNIGMGFYLFSTFLFLIHWMIFKYVLKVMFINYFDLLTLVYLFTALLLFIFLVWLRYNLLLGGIEAEVRNFNNYLKDEIKFIDKYKKLTNSDIYPDVLTFIKNLENKLKPFYPDEVDLKYIEDNDRLIKYEKKREKYIDEFYKYITKMNSTLTMDEIHRIISMEEIKMSNDIFFNELDKAKNKNLEGYVKRLLFLKRKYYQYFLHTFQDFLKTKEILVSYDDLVILIKKIQKDIKIKKFEKDFLRKS